MQIMTDEEDENELPLMVKAFEVHDTGEDLDLDLPPTTGNEYLRRVQLEARQCPSVVVANIDTSRFLKRQTVKISDTTGCPPAPKGFAPSLKWQKQQIADFSEMRQKLSTYKSRRTKEKCRKAEVNLPKLNDDVGWCQLCFGNPPTLSQQQVTGDQMSKPHTSGGVPPLLSIVSAMSQPLIEQVLTYHIHWLEATGFTDQQGKWFYALLASLEKPLTPEACSLLRALARASAQLRATLLMKDDPRLIPLNLIICLVARYFGQTDLADNT